MLTVLIVFCMTLDYRLEFGVEGLPSVTIVEALCYLAVLFLFARLAREGDALVGRLVAMHRKNRPVLWYFLWTGLASVASLVRSSDSLRFYKDLFPGLVVYVLISVCIVSDDAMKGSIIAFLVGCFLILMVGLSQSLTGLPRVVALGGAAVYKTDFWGARAGINLATGFFLHPNAYAIFLLPVALLFVGLLLHKGAGGPIRKVVLALLLALTAYNLAASFAKGVIVWVVVGTGLLLFVQRVRRPRAISTVVIMIALVAIISMYGVGALGAIDQPYGTMVTRLQLWKAGIDLIVNDPFVLFLGNGFSGMMASSELYAGSVYPNAHNTYINQVIYFGLPALLLYLALSVQALRRLSRIMRNSGYEGVAARVLFSTIAALLGIYFFEPANEGVILQMQFFAVLAFANAFGTGLGRSEPAWKIEPQET
jgi:O-antigen ligase